MVPNSSWRFGTASQYHGTASQYRARVAIPIFYATICFLFAWALHGARAATTTAGPNSHVRPVLRPALNGGCCGGVFHGPSAEGRCDGPRQAPGCATKTKIIAPFIPSFSAALIFPASLLVRVFSALEVLNVSVLSPGCFGLAGG
jgi:hypothetical protein